MPNGEAVGLSDYSEFVKDLTDFLKYEILSWRVPAEWIEASNDARLTVLQIRNMEKEGKKEYIIKKFTSPEKAAYFLAQFMKTEGANIDDYNFLLAKTNRNLIEIHNSYKLVEVQLPGERDVGLLQSIAQYAKDLITKKKHS